MGNVIMKAQQITYGASNVEKALDDLKAPELIELNKRMAAIDEWKANVHEVTYTGSELTINNALALPARSLITSIDAIQDLHGYDHPWAGGADVNKFDISSATMAGYISAFGLTVAKDSDGYITITGTYTGESGVPKFAIIPTLPLLDNAVFYLMDKNAAANTNVIQCRWSNPSTGGVAIDLQNMVQNQTYNIKFRLMIVTDGTVPTSYRPYSNICPISGRTEARVDTENEDSTESAYATIQLGTTVYGAEVDFDTGVMTVKTALVTLNGTEDWNVETTTQSSVYRYSLANGIDNIKTPVNNNTPLDCNSNMYIGITANESYVASKYGISNLSLNSNKLVVIDKTYNTNDVTAWKAHLANNPLQIEYELATPTTIQLTPTMLEMLKGYNRVTLADGYGEIELKALVLGGDN